MNAPTMLDEKVTVWIGDALVTVPGEVAALAYIEKMLGIPRSTLPIAVPAVPHLGEPWTGQGGIYAGTFCDPYGKPTYHLILADERPASMKWQQAKDWAAKLTVDGHSDFRLPRRLEGLPLFLNFGDHLDKEWHWLEEEYEPTPDFAWMQHFYDGNQSYDRKHDTFRARAVRQILVIQ